MRLRTINWFGIICAASLALLLFLSVAFRAPWWRLTIADGLGSVELSPMDADIRLLGQTVEVPILWYLNLGTKVTILLVAAMLFFSSLKIDGARSRRLMELSYKKPLYIVLGLIAIGALSKLLIGSLLPFDVPFVGTSTVVINARGATISVPVTATFTWVFGLAVIAAVLSLSARLYHSRVSNGFAATEG